MDAAAQQFLLECLNGMEAAKATHHTHTFFVPSCAAGHPYHAAFDAQRRYWRNWFGKTRDIPRPGGPSIPGRPKGFVRMALGDAHRAPDIATERGAA
jgi:hypothetical protein